MMKQFVDLYYKLLESEGLTLKLKYILNYIRNAPQEDCELVVWLLNGNRSHAIINSQLLKKWILAEACVPIWLFEESLNIVKDPEETLSLIAEPGKEVISISLSEWMEKNILPLKSMDVSDQKDFVIQRFKNLRQKDRLVFLKLLTGKLKLCADKKTLVKALCAYSKLDEEIITYRLSSYNYPEPDCYTRLLEVNNPEISDCRPLSFMPAAQLENIQSIQFNSENWLAEWKWKGVRVQVVKRNTKVYIWSKSHEFLSDKFPDLVEDLSLLPDNIILDGQLTSEQNPEAIHRRMNSKISVSTIKRYPVRLMVFDILEYECENLCQRILSERKRFLSRLFDAYSFRFIQTVQYFTFGGFEDLNLIRSEVNNTLADGLLIKDTQAVYLNSGAVTTWYSLKKERSRIKATLLYIQREYQNFEPGANTIKIMTFGVADGDSFVSVAKTDCNLNAKDLWELENYIRENTIEKVGPIRVLKPGLIFELTFDDILCSKRHKSGINIIAPHISQWMKELTLNDVDRIDHLREYAL